MTPPRVRFANVLASRQKPYQNEDFADAFLASGLKGLPSRTAAGDGRSLYRNDKLVQEYIEEQRKTLTVAACVTPERVIYNIVNVIEICSGQKDLPNKPGHRIFDATNTLRANELLGKNLRMFSDRLEIKHDVTIDLEAKLNEAIQKVQQIRGDVIDVTPQPVLQTDKELDNGKD